MAKRISKELEKLRSDPELVEPNFSIDVQSTDCWILSFICPADMIYEGEKYALRITFGPNYPIESPEILFHGPPPVHPHIYSNGHICLNILYDDWTPALTIKSVYLSILSMLHSATEKTLPPDNARYVAIPRRSPKETRFMFHDDHV